MHSIAQNPLQDISFLQIVMYSYFLVRISNSHHAIQKIYFNSLKKYMQILIRFFKDVKMD